MKLTNKSNFKPLKIEIILESELEVCDLYALFNTTCVSDACPHIDFHLMTELIEQMRYPLGKPNPTITAKLAAHTHVLSKVYPAPPAPPIPRDLTRS